MSNPVSRRGFLKGALVVAGGAPVVGALAGCQSRVDPAPIVDGPDLIDGKLVLELARYPDLHPVGGALTVRARGLRQPLIIVHVDDAARDANAGAPAAPRFVALTSLCTHAGCPVGYVPAGPYLECPCHAARFEVGTGAVKRGPALAGLRTYPTRYEPTAGDVIVDTLAGDLGLPAVKDRTITVPLADFPALSMVGGSIIGTPAGLGRPLLVARVDDATVVALEATCTHLDCLVAYDSDAKDVTCPCHGSRFDLAGKVKQSPATVPLGVYSVSFDGTVAIIAL